MMRTVHYASYEINGIEACGTAELVNGSGYLFRKDGEHRATLVSYTDVNLLLFGRVDIADAKWAEDTSTGDLARLLGKAA
jgi:hypothetical protein